MVEHPRTVRSFVRRSGRLTEAQQRALDELWSSLGVADAATPLDFDELFGRGAPRILEIGFGNGESLVELAAARPDCDFLGIEVHRPGIGHCLLHAEAAGIDNLRLIDHDALDVLDARIAAGSLARINLYFPDPWPKKRHHKRRLVSDGFLALAAARLAPGGHLHMATDWANYAEQIDEVIARSSCFRVVERRQHAGDRPLARPTTKFERRGLRRGHRITDWQLVRD